MSKSQGSERLESLKKQGLSQMDMIQRLNAMIDAENSLPASEKDREFIQSCIDLQWFLMTGEQYDSNKQAARKRLNRFLRSRAKPDAFGRRRVIAALSAAACTALLLIALPVAGQMLLQRGEIVGRSVHEGEIYRLDGAEADPKLLQEAMAEGDKRDMLIATSDYDLLLSMLPEIGGIHPSYVPEGWVGYLYRYEVTEGITFYKERYRAEGIEKEILFQRIVYDDYDSVSQQIEQDGEGFEKWIGEKKVYLTHNLDMMAASWTDGLTVYGLYGPIGQAEMERMILSIGEEGTGNSIYERESIHEDDGMSAAECDHGIRLMGECDRGAERRRTA